MKAAAEAAEKEAKKTKKKRDKKNFNQVDRWMDGCNSSGSRHPRRCACNRNVRYEN